MFFGAVAVVQGFWGSGLVVRQSVVECWGFAVWLIPWHIKTFATAVTLLSFWALVRLAGDCLYGQCVLLTPELAPPDCNVRPRVAARRFLLILSGFRVLGFIGFRGLQGFALGLDSAFPCRIGAQGLMSAHLPLR